MDIKDLLARTGGLDAIARELGLNPAQAASGAAALLPAILGGFGKQTQAQPGGFAGLGGLLGQLGGGGLLDNVLAPEPTDVGLGNNVLGQIFGGKDVSRAVAQDAAGRSGLDPAMLKRMLPILAMLVAGYMAKQHGRAAPGAAAGAMPGAGAGSGLGGPGGLGGLLGGLLGGGGSGNPLDEILRGMGR